MRQIGAVVQAFQIAQSKQNSVVSFGLFHMADELLTTWRFGAYSRQKYPAFAIEGRKGGSTTVGSSLGASME